MARVNLWDVTYKTHYTGDNIFRDSNGYIHVVGFENMTSGSDLYYAISTDNGVTFTDGEGGGSGTYKTLTTGDPPVYHWSPAVVVDSSDNIYVFWIDEGTNDLNFIKKTGGSGGTWGSVTSITDVTGWQPNRCLRVEIDNDDNIIISATTASVTHIYTSVDGGSNWVHGGNYSEGVTINHSDLCLDYNQNLWFVSEGASGGVHYIKVRKIIKTEGSPDTWAYGTRTELYSSSSHNPDSPAIIAEKDSETIWVFARRNYWDGGWNYKLSYKKYSGGSWDTSWTDIADFGTTLYWRFNVVRDYSNNIHLFMTKFASPYGAYYLKYDSNSATWSNIIDTGFVNTPYLGVEQPNLPSGATHIYTCYSVDEATDRACFNAFEIPIDFYGSDTTTITDEIFEVLL